MKPTSTVKVNRFAKRCVTPAMAARKALLRRVQRQEIRRLQSLVPRLSNLPHRQVDEVTVIEEAVRFIDQLHRTLLARIANGTISPATLQGVNVAELQRLQSGRHMAAPISSRPLINGPNRKSY